MLQDDGSWYHRKLYNIDSYLDSVIYNHHRSFILLLITLYCTACIDYIAIILCR